jgi:hypothetical protein
MSKSTPAEQADLFNHSFSTCLLLLRWLYRPPEKTDYADFISWTQREVPLKWKGV